MSNPRFFKEAGFVSHATRMSDQAYGAALDSLVIVTSEALVMHRGNILFELRNHAPLKGQWCTIGGRKIPGESFEEAAARVLKQETGVGIDPGRFRLLPFPPYSIAWATRAQEPTSNGSHTDTVGCVVEITDSEADAFKHLGSSFRWLDPAGIVAQSQSFHPWIVQMMRDLIAWMS